MQINSTNINCPSCHSSNQADARFCLNCGAALTGQNQSPYQSPASQQVPVMAADFIYAGFWKRLIAYIIDIILIYAFILLVATTTVGVSLNMFTQTQSTTALPTVAFIYFGFYITWWMYFAIQESTSAQATLGKRALGIKVTDIYGHQLSFGHAAGRQLAGIVSSITLLIGYLMAAFTGRKQALHDLIANAVVVNKHFGAQQIQTVNQSPPPGMGVGAIIGVICLVLIIPVGGIIAAIALPAYQDYTMRAKVSEAIVTASQPKTAIVEYATSSGYWPNNFEQIGFSTSDMQMDNFYIQLENNGVIVINFTKPQIISTSSIRMVPELNNNGEYTWSCHGVQMKPVYLPVACK